MTVSNRYQSLSCPHRMTRISLVSAWPLVHEITSSNHSGYRNVEVLKYILVKFKKPRVRKAYHNMRYSKHWDEVQQVRLTYAAIKRLKNCLHWRLFHYLIYLTKRGNWQKVKSNSYECSLDLLSSNHTNPTWTRIRFRSSWSWLKLAILQTSSTNANKAVNPSIRTRFWNGFRKLYWALCRCTPRTYCIVIWKRKICS